MEVVTQPQSGNHIYMEVDPLYYTNGYNGGNVSSDGPEKGMVSSSSSQTSSDHLYPSQIYYETTPSEEYSAGDERQYQCQGVPAHQSLLYPSQNLGHNFATKEKMMSVYSISQNANIPMQQASEQGHHLNHLPTSHPIICKQLGGAERI